MTQRLDYEAVAADGVRALGGVHRYVAKSGLPPDLIDLAYLRASQINGCPYLHRHAHARCLEARGRGREAHAGVGVARHRSAVLAAGTRGAAMGGGSDADPPRPARPIPITRPLRRSSTRRSSST